MKYTAVYKRQPTLFETKRLRVNTVTKDIEAPDLTAAVKWAAKIKIDGFMLIGVKQVLALNWIF